MKATDHSPRRADRFAFLPRIAPLRVALCALLLAGCTTGGPQGNGDLAGRQDPATVSAVSVATVMSIAERLRATGNLPSAIAFYRRAIVLDPNQVKPYIGLGDALLADGEPNPAAESFRSALAMAPDNVEALRGLGQTLVALNKPVEAVEMLERSIRMQPTARAYGALGVAYNLMGKSADATEAYKHGLTLAPDDLDLLNNYGLSQAIGGDFNGAVATLRRAAMDPRATSRNRLNLAMALGLAGRDQDAAQVARIDLDERAVKNNLAYYAELRGLSPTARAEAILRPSSPVLAHLAEPICDGKPCASPALPGREMSAAPTTPVKAKPLASASGASAKSAAAEKKAPEAAAAAVKPAAKQAQNTKHHEAAAKEAADSRKPAKPMPHEVSAKATPVGHDAKAATTDATATTTAPEAKPDAAKTAAADTAPAAMPEEHAKSTAELNTAELNKDQSQRLAMTEPAKPAEAAPMKLTPQADAAPTPAPKAADNAKPAPTPSTDASTHDNAAAAQASDTAPAPSGAPLPITAQADQAPAKTPEATTHAMDKAETKPEPDSAPSASQFADAMPNPVYPTYPPATTTEHEAAAAKPMTDSMPTASASDKPAGSLDAMRTEMPQQTASLPEPAAPAAAPAATPDKTAAAPATPSASFVAATGEPSPTMQDLATDAAANAAASPVVKAAAVVGAMQAVKSQPWVQLGTFRSEDNAKAQLKQTATDHKDLLNGLPLSIHRVDLGTVRGVYYLLRVGPAGNLAQARDLCSGLKSHNLDCMIVK